MLTQKLFQRAVCRQGVLIACLYAVIAFALLSPMASPYVLPDIPDTQAHVSLIVQARMALEEGQFPLRVAPWEHNGWRIPFYQFYNQVPSTVGGLIYKYLTPSNPYMAYLIVVWLSLTVAALFIYRISLYLTSSVPASVMAGTIYVSAPYFLINIHARGDFGEAVAQAVLPVVLYYVVICSATLKPPYILASSIAWFVLATTHIITFVYSSIFIGLFVVCFNLTKRKAVKALASAGIGYVLGWLLAFYFLAPVALETDLQIRHDGINNPFDSNWVVPLPTLLSPVSLPPEPQPGLHKIPPSLYPSVGWLMLTAWVVVVYYYVVSKKENELWPTQLERTRHFVVPLLGLFALALFMVWSPFDFWQFLPRSLWVTQFTYRILTQVMWTGALLSAYALVLLFRARLDGRHLVVGLLLVTIASSSYLPILHSSSTTIGDLVKQPTIGYGKYGFLYYIKGNKLLYTREKPPLVYDDGWMMLDTIQNIFLLPGYHPTLYIEGKVRFKWFTKPINLEVLIDGTKVASKTLYGGRFSWELPLAVPTNGERFKLEFKTDAFVIPKQIEPKSTDERHLAIKVNNISIKGIPAIEESIVSVSATQQDFHQKGDETIGEVSVLKEAQIVQLPVLFYPHLLEIKVDGRRVDYFAVPMPYTYVLVGLRLPAGTHKIVVSFVGLRWANWVSSIAWLVVIGSLVITAIVENRHRLTLT